MASNRCKVIARPGTWPFLECIDVLQSDYVDPVGHSPYSKDWRRIFLGSAQYHGCLYGIVERYVIAEKGKAGAHVAWVHRDDPNVKIINFQRRNYPFKFP